MTIIIVTVSMLGGAILGLAACLGSLNGGAVTKKLCRMFIVGCRSVPDILVMFWIYYCGPLLLNVSLSSWVAAVVSMSIYAAAYLAEVFRAGIEGVARGQHEAATALGFGVFTKWRNVILPQAIRIGLPAFLGILALMVKVSGVASAIGVGELVFEADIISSETYRHFEFYTAIAVIYFIMIFPMSLTVQILEKMARNK